MVGSHGAETDTTAFSPAATAANRIHHPPCVRVHRSTGFSGGGSLPPAAASCSSSLSSSPPPPPPSPLAAPSPYVSSPDLSPHFSLPSTRLTLQQFRVAGQGDPREEGRLLHRRREVRGRRVCCSRSMGMHLMLFLFAPRSGLWGFACRSSTAEKENCVLRCLSPECYNLIYGGDPVSGGAVWKAASEIFALISDGEFLLCCGSLRKGNWTMSAAMSTSTACTSKTAGNIWNVQLQCFWIYTELYLST